MTYRNVAIGHLTDELRRATSTLSAETGVFEMSIHQNGQVRIGVLP